MSKNSQTTINTLRMLSMAQITKAKSGHPGIALGAAPIMYALFRDHLIIDPNDPLYFNRDRFILSAGHGSSLLYATMLCAGYKSISMDDLKNFRQINAKTAGHPEPSLIKGIEVATGPLGQGVAMAVGMAIGEAKMAAKFNQYNNIINHRTYCLLGDGCSEEGIFYEAFALAGKLKLNKLTFLYDSNKIQLDGPVSDSTNTKMKLLCRACNINYIYVKQGNDYKDVSIAIALSKLSKKPTLIEINTTIGYGSDKANCNTCHGSPFNEEQLENIKNNLHWNYPLFTIPNCVQEDFSNVIFKRVKNHKLKFNKDLNYMEQRNLQLYYQFNDCITNKFGLNIDWYKSYQVKDINATRNVMGDIVNIACKNLSSILVGSADLTSSTKIGGKHLNNFTAENYRGTNINYGVREFGMTSIINGIVAHGGIKAIGSTFLVFSDYAKAAIRLAAVSHIPAINIYSHDSITVGEDGPTHQPIEQLNSLRMIPNHYLFRPYNFHECLYALDFALKSKSSPVTIATSRGEFKQTPTKSFNDIAKGAYFIQKHAKYHLTILATGSEVATAIEVASILHDSRITANVVSVPCLNLFAIQDKTYQKLILGNKPTFSIEYGNTSLWYKYVNHPIGINGFGLSGKGSDVVETFNLSPAQIAKTIITTLKGKK